MTCDVYADDNTLSFHHQTPLVVKGTMETASNMAIQRRFKQNYMQANPSKFQAMVLNRQGNTTNLVFNIDTVTLKPNTIVKLLGVHLDNQLNVNEHIRCISTTCAKQVNAMARLSRSTDSKTNILNSFLLSNFNFCSVVYHQCSMSDARKMERIQKRALRYVLNGFHSPYKDLLHAHGREAFTVCRKTKVNVRKCLQNNTQYVTTF